MRSVLMHDVDINPAVSDFPCPYAPDGQFHLCLVIKGRESLVAVESLFILRCGLPHGNGNAFTCLWFNGKVRTRLAALEKQFIIWNFRCTDDPCRRASHFHLPDVQVASVSDIISFFHNGIHPFRRVRVASGDLCRRQKHRPSREARLTLLPP